MIVSVAEFLRFADSESTYKLFTPSADALAAVLQRMQLCFFGTSTTEDAARKADSIIHHLQQDLVGNLCTILQGAQGSDGASKGSAAAISALQVWHWSSVSHEQNYFASVVWAVYGLYTQSSSASVAALYFSTFTDSVSVIFFLFRYHHTQSATADPECRYIF